MYSKLFLLSFVVFTAFFDESKASDDNAEIFVSIPLTHETYKHVLENNSIVFVKFFTNW